jgi:molybdopterin converting factor small subunit
VKVEVNLYASLARLVPRRPADRTMDVSEEETILDLLGRLGVPMEKVKIIFLNGIHASGLERLKDGDRIGVFPPVAGG